MPDTAAVTVCSYTDDVEEDGFKATVRLPLKTRSQLETWLREFQMLSKITIRKSRTYPGAGRKLAFKAGTFVVQ